MFTSTLIGSSILFLLLAVILLAVGVAKNNKRRRLFLLSSFLMFDLSIVLALIPIGMSYGLFQF